MEIRLEEEPAQEALFQLEGPDEDGCVWACSPEGRDTWCQNLGPTEKVAEVMSQCSGLLTMTNRSTSCATSETIRTS